MKKVLAFLSMVATIVYLNVSSFAIDPTIYMGNHVIWGAVYISSFSINPTTFNSGAPSNGSTTLAIISSTTYINKADVTLTADKNGVDVFLSSTSAMSTATGKNCFKLYPGQSVNCGGKNLDAIYARTLAGSSSGATVWYIISYQDR